MKEYDRNYDSVSDRTWIDYECTKCGSKNITPMGKRQEGKNSVCHYLCEGCGHSPEEEFVYAINGEWGLYPNRRSRGIGARQATD